MRTQSEAVTAVQGSIASLPAGRWVLAVSGGRDSMVLLDAMAAQRRTEIAAIATFDHGTGAASTQAAALVERTALALELPVVLGTMTGSDGGGTEAAWREARWRFLNGWADELRARVVTAHSRDDQIETVVLRLLREAGPRGLAGMLAVPSPAVRPLLQVPRRTIAAYAEECALDFIDDPSNLSVAHQRNRVRLEILPALDAAHRGFSAWCWHLSVRAAAWRSELVDFVDAVVQPTAVERGVVFAASPLLTLGESEWAVLWPELAARAAVTMDWRGIARASAWAPTAKAGASIPLAGGAVIERTASTFVIRAAAD